MIIQTASEGVSFAKKLENDSSEIYRGIIKQYARDEDLFQTFIKENRKNVTQVERAYYGVITDAIEGSYAFNIETDKYSIDIGNSGESDYTDILKKLSSIEETIIRFYTEAAEQSKSLMADLPRVFFISGKKKKEAN